jgi:hypothetical protein
VILWRDTSCPPTLSAEPISIVHAGRGGSMGYGPVKTAKQVSACHSGRFRSTVMRHGYCVKGTCLKVRSAKEELRGSSKSAARKGSCWSSAS